MVKIVISNFSGGIVYHKESLLLRDIILEHLTEKNVFYSIGDNIHFNDGSSWSICNISFKLYNSIDKLLYGLQEKIDNNNERLLMVSIVINGRTD